MYMKKHLPIIVAILLPIVVVLSIITTVYVSKSNISPEYDLVYAVYNSYGDYGYTADGDVVVKNEYENKSFNRENTEAEVYIYDFEKEESMKVDNPEGLELTKAGNISPDGYRVSFSYGRGNGVFEIFGGYNRDYGFIISDGKSDVFKKIDIVYDYRNPDILGWVK